MYKVVLDLEMNDCIDDKFKSSNSIRKLHEIIQIGAVLLDDNYNEIDCFSIFVKPRFGRLSRSISKLTGIVESDIINAVDIEDAFKEFLNFIPDLSNTTLYTWSESDKKAIRAELNCKSIKNSDLSNLLLSVVDVQKLYRKFLKLNTVFSLDKAIYLSGIDTDESLHNALHDARYTGKLLKIVEGDDEVDRISINRMKSYFETPSLGVSIGSLFDLSNLICN